MSVFIDLTLRLFINSCLYIQVKIKLLYLLRFLGTRTKGEAKEVHFLAGQDRRFVHGGLRSSSGSSDPAVEDGL